MRTKEVVRSVFAVLITDDPYATPLHPWSMADGISPNCDCDAHPRIANAYPASLRPGPASIAIRLANL
jgi:hypothetical protein